MGGGQQGVVAAPTTRSSIGKPIGRRRRSISAEHPLERLARVLARDAVLHLGEAHRRSLAKTRWLRSRCSAPPISDATGSVQRRDRAAGSAGRAGRRARPPRSRQHVADQGARRRRGRRLAIVRSEVSVSARARVRASRTAPSGRVRPPARRAACSTSSSGRGSSTRWIVKAGTQRSVTAVIAPRAPERDPGGAAGRRRRDLGAPRRARDEAHSLHLRREVAEAPARAVGGRGDRARERSAGRCRPGSPSRGRASRVSPQPPRSVMPASTVTLARRRSQHPAHPAQVDHHAVGARDVGERVAGADDLDARGAAQPPRRAPPRCPGARSARARSAVRRAQLTQVGKPPRGCRDSAAASTLSARAPSAPRGRAACRAGRPRRPGRPCSPCQPR